MRFLIPLIGALALSACMTMQQDVVQSIEYACASASAALKTVIILNDKLTPEIRAQVTRAVTVIDPVCSQEQVPTLDATAHAALTGALSQLTAAAAATQNIR